MELKNGTALKGGEYIIKRKLGQGGMGITYLATMRVEVRRGLGTVTTQADVVVKEFFIGNYCERDGDGRTVTVISRKFNDAVEAGLKKFRKEAINLSQMRHQYIVHVIDLFDENDTQYIVMDFLPGGSLQEYVDKRGSLTVADAIKHISEVASALQYMHSKKLCHFDVKPGNVMLGDKGQAVLIDFGIAKHYGSDNRHTSNLLYMGVSEGYAPLEQATDAVESFSPPTDVYALGATLYFLLTGKAPGKASFNINNVLPATRPAAIPESLWQFIRHCMQPNPQDRPADAAMFLRLLNEKKYSQPVQSPRPSIVDAPGKTRFKSGVNREEPEPLFIEPLPELELVEGEFMFEQGEEQPVQSKVLNVRGVEFRMIHVEGGTFTMGASEEQKDEADKEEKPAHQVTLSSFMIGETEVTQKLWQAVMGSNPSCYKYEKLPLENVSWEDCQMFIKRLNELTGEQFRLPTEAEWEFAARGGNKSRHTLYAGSNDLDSVAWYIENSGNSTHEVATKQPNELGLYDMSGNVFEWCNDWCGDYSSSPQTNPRGPLSGYLGRVLRGGSWRIFDMFCRVSSRFSNIPTFQSSGIGMRLAL